MGKLEGPKIDSKFWTNVIGDWLHSFNYWLSDHYHSMEAKPSLKYSKKAAIEMQDRISKTKLDNLKLYVTHDLTLIALLFHGFSILPNSDYTSFLNGFLIQKIDNKIYLLVKDFYREVDYLYWWNYY